MNWEGLGWRGRGGEGEKKQKGSRKTREPLTATRKTATGLCHILLHSWDGGESACYSVKHGVS